jgi:predicted PurR-regulated permease PerM
MGMAAFGLKGIFIGPILASVPVVFWKLMKRQHTTGVNRKLKNKNE